MSSIVRVVGLLIGVLTAYIPVAALAQEACVKIETVRSISEREGLRLVKLTDAQALQVQVDYNTAPPVSNDVFDAVYVATDPKSPRLVGILPFKGSCLYNPQTIPREHLERVIGAPV